MSSKPHPITSMHVMHVRAVSGGMVFDADFPAISKVLSLLKKRQEEENTTYALAMADNKHDGANAHVLFDQETSRKGLTHCSEEVLVKLEVIGDSDDQVQSQANVSTGTSSSNGALTKFELARHYAEGSMKMRSGLHMRRVRQTDRHASTKPGTLPLKRAVSFSSGSGSKDQPITTEEDVDRISHFEATVLKTILTVHSQMLVRTTLSCWLRFVIEKQQFRLQFLQNVERMSLPVVKRRTKRLPWLHIDAQLFIDTHGKLKLAAMSDNYRLKKKMLYYWVLASAITGSSSSNS